MEDATIESSASRADEQSCQPAAAVADAGSANANTGAGSAAVATVPDAAASSYDHKTATFWTALIGFGLVFEFLGRLFGLQGNPTGLWLEFIPLLSTVISALIILFAVLRLMPAWSMRNLANFRQSVLMILLGTTMLVGSMACKPIVAAVFG
ncbi:MAG: hypothetical protein FWF71_05190 [Actinomycetia bacterium]|nr:hypothetical protein [Actinomycetes bacterium]